MSLVNFTKIAGVIFLTIATPSCQLFLNPTEDWQVNKKRYHRTDASETELRVSLHDQKAWLLDGKGAVILKTNVSTGVTGHETPTGKLTVLEKKEEKRSNRYGQYVKVDTGEVVIAKAWLHQGPPPKGTAYQGISMPYWMRLTWWGVGMHVGKFPPHTRCSFGCIRVFHDAQPWIYHKVKVGTPVNISSESLLVEMAKREKFSVF